MLALLGHYPQATDEEQGRSLQIVELRQQHMEKLAQAAPVNFLHKYELVEAEKRESWDRTIEPWSFMLERFNLPKPMDLFKKKH